MPSLRNSRAYQHVKIELLLVFSKATQMDYLILFSLRVFNTHFFCADIFPHVRQFLLYPTSFWFERRWGKKRGNSPEDSNTPLHAWKAVLWPVIPVYF